MVKSRRFKHIARRLIAESNDADTLIALMQIAGVGNFPLQAAKAYGVKSPAPSAAPAPMSLTPAARPQAVDAYQASSAVQRLVAGSVQQRIDFDASPVPPRSDAAVLPMYTRAADKIEAAVAVQLGRTLDLKG